VDNLGVVGDDGDGEGVVDRDRLNLSRLQGWRVRDVGSVSPSGAGAYARRRVIPRDASGRVIPREELEPGELEPSGLWVMDTPWTRESLARGNVLFE
jgi:hypothetical protein